MSPPAEPEAGPLTDDDEMHQAQMHRAMELLFFAYRDFTAVADALLADFGFGRAHHRALYFVGRTPGMTVGELLEVLKITKQSLARVLGQLVREGFIAQDADSSDRRRRQLRLTAKGRDLDRRLVAEQSRLIRAAYRDAGADAVGGFKQVLMGIINPEDRGRFEPKSGGS
ncbi:MAG: MarR family transcriptional regulator [Rhodospirillales bacterium]|nr:MarR family transcriptional regulator [Rhodospirillales bacterium]